MNSSKPKLIPNRWDLLVAAFVLVLAIVTAVIFYGGLGQSDALAVTISVGDHVQEMKLSDFPGDGLLLENNGYTLYLQKTDSGDGLFLSESNCPTQDCVHTGTIRRAGQSIICLPSQIVISLTGTSDASPDAVLG